MNRAFIGSSLLLSQLKGSGADLVYLSGAPQLIGLIPRRFLQAAEFPAGELSLRESLSQTIEESKYQRSVALMRASPHKIFVFIGDNGERDVPTFQRLLENPEFSGRVKMVLIHKMYGAGVGYPIPTTELSYLTSADLAMHLFQAQLLDAQDLNTVLREVVGNLSNESALTRENDLPNLDQVEPGDLPFLRTFISQQTLNEETLSLVQAYHDHLAVLAGPTQSESTGNFLPICREALATW